MDQSTATILGATIAALVAVLGWHAAHRLSSEREDRTRRLETILKHTQRQIDEFYGPLVNLIEQIFATWSVRERILFPDGRPQDLQKSALLTEGIPAFFQEFYFFPLHERIREILMTKLHLIEGAEPPKSFQQYLEHSTQQMIQHRLWKELGIATDHVAGVPWPGQFYYDVHGTLTSLMKRYDACLADLYNGGVYSTESIRGV